MKQPQLAFQTFAALVAALLLSLTVQVASAAFIGNAANMTVDPATATITGAAVPGGGGKTFPALVTANTGGILTISGGGNTSGEIFFTSDPITHQGGTANNLNVNIPGGFALALNGYGYADLTNFGGNAIVKARDGDATKQDFILSDYGGNDNFAVAAILPDGTVGQKVLVASSVFTRVQLFEPGGVNPTGTSVTPPNIQQTGFLSFDISDLLDGVGANLSPSASIRGIRIFENQQPDPFVADQRLDLGVFIADVVPIPEPSTAWLVGMSLVGLVASRRRAS